MVNPFTLAVDITLDLAARGSACLITHTTPHSHGGTACASEVPHNPLLSACACDPRVGRPLSFRYVDLHRNLSRKWHLFASKNNPSAVPWIFEKAAIPFARGGLFPGCKSRVNPACKSTMQINNVLHVRHLCHQTGASLVAVLVPKNPQYSPSTLPFYHHLTSFLRFQKASCETVLRTLYYYCHGNE